jgi:hypothetical protein
MLPGYPAGVAVTPPPYPTMQIVSPRFVPLAAGEQCALPDANSGRRREAERAVSLVHGNILLVAGVIANNVKMLDHRHGGRAGEIVPRGIGARADLERGVGVFGMLDDQQVLALPLGSRSVVEIAADSPRIRGVAILVAHPDETVRRQYRASDGGCLSLLTLSVSDLLIGGVSSADAVHVLGTVRQNGGGTEQGVDNLENAGPRVRTCVVVLSRSRSNCTRRP